MPGIEGFRETQDYDLSVRVAIDTWAIWSMLGAETLILTKLYYAWPGVFDDLFTMVHNQAGYVLTHMPEGPARIRALSFISANNLDVVGILAQNSKIPTAHPSGPGADRCGN